MKRRSLIKNAFHLGLGFTPLVNLASSVSIPAGGITDIGARGPKRPLTVYNNWSAYDELSDNIPLTEELAMKQLGELVRLKKNGVSVDYYMMDAFWFDKAGGYRTWHRERWPNGPGKWLDACSKHNILPGMWFSTNDRIANGDQFFLDLIPEWKDSTTTNPKALSLFRGGYLKHLSDTLQIWYDKGVRAFKFDFARFDAADEETRKKYTVPEIIEKNQVAFIGALKNFRNKNKDVLLVGYNGFGGEMSNTYMPFKKSVDSRWLEVFDTLYCGDPRFSDVPASNIWRSQDIYSDHMVRQYELNNIPIHRIDNCGFMTGVAGTCYKRGMNAWKGMQILELARGGWLNVYHGNLEFFSDMDARWFAKTQHLYMDLQQYGVTASFGSIPGERNPYGFVAAAKKGTVCTVVNPSQAFAEMELPAGAFSSGSVMYADGGFKPVLDGNRLTIGPEQLVVAGFGEYAHQQYDLGTDQSINIPLSIEPVPVVFNETEGNTIEGSVVGVRDKDLRIFVQQFGADHYPHRSSGGPPPGGKNMDTIIGIMITQNGKPVRVSKQYDKMIWSGLSWGAVEVNRSDFDPVLPVMIRCSSTENEKLALKAEVFAVAYNQ